MKNKMNIPFTYPVAAVLLLGPTGAGKSPLGEAIAQNGLFNRPCHHLDFGFELRNAISNKELSAAYSNDELDFITGVLERGLLLENEHFLLARKIVYLFLAREKFIQHDILVLNGIPRHTGQARDLAAIACIHSIVVLDCTTDAVFWRIQQNAGGDRTERVDDAEELIKKKLAIFYERTAPLIEFYERKACAVFRLKISGATTARDAYQQLSSLAAHPPVAFIIEPPQ